MGLVAPIVLFTVLATFYNHLGTDGSSMPRIVVDDRSGTQDGARFAQALEQACDGGETSTGLGSMAAVTVPEGFDARLPNVEIDLLLPLPGARVAITRLVEVAHWRAFGPALRVPDMQFRSLPDPLDQSSAIGLALLFVMFSLASSIGRGLGDHEAGLGDRLASLRVGRLRRMLSRTVALSGMGFLQVVSTLGFALVWQGTLPGSSAGMLLAAAAGALAAATTLQALAAICGTSARFAAVAPVMVMSLGVASGAMVPVVLMPESFRAVGAWLFLSWANEGLRMALDGGIPWRDCLSLMIWACAALVVAVLAERAPR
jgi:hypothetical protein